MRFSMAVVTFVLSVALLPCQGLTATPSVRHKSASVHSAKKSAKR
jgi:hypothetical protein